MIFQHHMKMFIYPLCTWPEFLLEHPRPFPFTATIRNINNSSHSSTMTSTLDKCLYVDDLICSTPSGQAADKPKLSFKMQEWTYANGVQTLEGCACSKWKCPIEKCCVKGSWTNKENGAGWLRLWSDEQNKTNTERDVLQAAARIVDSIGFLSPFPIRVTCLFPTNVGMWTWMGQWASWWSFKSLAAVVHRVA